MMYQLTVLQMLKTYHCLNLLLCDHISVPDSQVSFGEAQVGVILVVIDQLRTLVVLNLERLFALKSGSLCFKVFEMEKYVFQGTPRHRCLNMCAVAFLSFSPPL